MGTVAAANRKAEFNDNLGLPDVSFDWSGYLDLAKELNDNLTRNRDAKQRSVVSRVYYAVFNLAKEYLEQVEGHSIPRTADAHRYVGNQFLVSADPRKQLIASQLVRLRRLRNQADYAVGFPALAFSATQSIETAEDIIQALKSLKGVAGQ